jgi:hypothetical protein
MNREKLVLRIIIVILTIILILFIFRDLILTTYLNRKIARFNERYHAELKIDQVKVQWIAAVRLQGITLKPVEGDTLLHTSRVYVSIDPVRLLLGRIAIQDVEVKDFRLTIIRRDSSANYRFLLISREKKDDTVRNPVNYASLADRFMGMIFDKIPRWLNVENINISANSNGHKVEVHLDRLDLKDQSFKTFLHVKEDTLSQQWDAEGRIDKSARMLTFRLFNPDRGKIHLPFLRYKWNASVELDSLNFSVAEQVQSDDSTTLTGIGAVYGLQVSHQAIASQPVLFDTLSADYSLTFGRDFIRYDSISRVVFNHMELHPLIKYRPYPTGQFTFVIHTPVFPAENLFSSFPPGLFTNLEGLKARGGLSFSLDFFVDLAVPDSLIFDMELKRHQFGLLSFGNTSLRKLDSSFLYTAYDKDIPVRTFMVGPESPDFRTLNRISPYLQYAVMTSEDGGFYQHRGFLQDAFRESIIQNIKERRFARGGSTISMQLVKNVFLSRNKTIARKMEEALLVWLIENQGIATKDRMYEVYLNIIEWGPGIYGANEASHFYFNKESSKLTLPEAIFLASIIPRPKWFMYSFDESGHLRPSMADYYRLVSSKMLSKGWISQRDFDNLKPDIELRGQAKLLLKTADTLE